MREFASEKTRSHVVPRWEPVGQSSEVNFLFSVWRLTPGFGMFLGTNTVGDSSEKDKDRHNVYSYRRWGASCKAGLFSFVGRNAYTTSMSESEKINSTGKKVAHQAPPALFLRQY